MKKQILGLDIGGTKTECALVEFKTQAKNSSFNILAQKRISTDRTLGYATVLEKVKDLCLEILKEGNSSLEQIEGVGIGLPGTVHPTKQVMLNGNSGIFIQKKIATDLNNLLPKKTKIICINDATSFTQAEVRYGAGLKYYNDTGKPISQHTCIGIILGTGTGGGIIINGKVLNGKSGGAGEIGHMQLVQNGHPCFCGRDGCAEQYLSGPALEALFATRLYSQIETRPNCPAIFSLADNNDPIAIAVVKKYKKYLTSFLVNLTNIFDPDYFVLGGGLSNQNIIYENLETLIAQDAFVPSVSPRIYKHQIGDSSGVIGAATLLL